MENLSGRILLNELNNRKFIDPFQYETQSLRCFQYETLDAGTCRSFAVAAQTCVIFIPVTGDLLFCDPQHTPQPVSVEEVFAAVYSEKTSITVQNPFGEDQISFLFFQIKTLFSNPKPDFGRAGFDLSRHGLSAITPKLKKNTGIPFRLHIGTFSGREEATYTLEKDRGFFCFVLAGAFEVQGRLLHPEDALVLWNTEHIEMEALSHQAILITLDIPYICL